MKSFRYLLLILLGFYLVLSPRATRAQDEDPTVEMARQRFKEGIDFFDAKQFQKARAAFLQAYALKKHPAVLLNLAQSELRSGHEADAADHFSEFLREAKEQKPDERRAALAGLVDAKKSVAEVTIQVDEKGADVLVDSKSRGVSPLPGAVYLTPGSHTVTVQKGGREVSTTLSVEAGDSTSTKLALKPAGEDLASSTGPLVGEAGEDSQADREKSEAPAEDLSEEGAWLWQHPAALVIAGLAVAGVGSGVGFSLSASSNFKNADKTALLIEAEAKKDGEAPTGICTRIGDISARRGPARANDYQNACLIYQDNVDRGDAMKTAAIVGFSIGGAAVIGTVIYYVVDTSSAKSGAAARAGAPERHTEIAVSPTYTPGYSGVTLSGSF